MSWLLREVGETVAHLWPYSEPTDNLPSLAEVEILCVCE